MVRPILPKQEERESPSLDCSDPPRTTKRRCISSACIPCRRRKSKCDGVMPACSTCKAVYRMECVYDVDGDRRRKGATEKERKNDSLDNLVSRLRSAPENEVDTIVDQLCTTAASTLGNCLGTRPEKRKSSDEPYLQAEERTFVQDMGKLQIDEQGDMRHFGHSSSLESIHTWPRRICLPPEPVTTGPLWTNVTSDNELISQLLDLYFTWHHPAHVLFSKSCFLSDMNKNRTKYCSPLLVNAILAVASHYSERFEARSNPSDPSTLGDHFFAEARRLLLAEEGHSSLTGAQALALMALREAGCGRDSTSWMYCGRSLHVALDLGLHLPAKLESSNRFSPTEVEVRRITLWGLFVLDKLWSMHFGRIPQLPSSVVGIPKPSIFQQLEAEPWISPDGSGRPCHTMEVSIQYVELAEILGDVLMALHSPKKQFDTVLLREFHQRLKRWHEKLPHYMDPQEDTVPAIYVLHMFYQSIILLVFSPFFYLPLESALPETPRQTGVAAAIEICTVFSYYQNGNYDSYPLGMIPHILLSAALVFLQENNLQTTTTSSPSSTHAFDEIQSMSSSLAYNLERCILNLRKMSSTWELSSQTLHVIWSRATSIDLPPRVKKALYSEAFSGLALTTDLEFDQKSLEMACVGGGLLDGHEGIDGCDCLDFSSFQPEQENPWTKGSGEDLQLEASVANLLGDVSYDVNLGTDGWNA